MKRKEPSPRGMVAVDRLPGRFEGLKWPVKEGFERFNVCSGAKGIWSRLSPMKIGPIQLSLWGITPDIDPGVKLKGVELPTFATNIENLWQFSKVWEGEEDESDQFPIKQFFERRARGWRDPKPHRHVKKGSDPINKNIPMYMLWKGKRLTYLEGRRYVYCPIYAAMVKETEAFKVLYKKVHEEQTNVLLLGYDGYNKEKRSWKECFEDTSRPFGHEMVLACLLEGEAPWE